MINLFLFLSIAFLFTFIVGRLMERIRMPWVFAALIFGALLAVHNPFIEVTSSPTFLFLAQLGMYFLLFVIGFELDLKELKKREWFIVRATFFVILFEAFFGSLLIRFVFGYDWIISIIVATSFATVGEAVLIPILDEFRIINTKLGQSIIGIGILDDVIEIILLVCLMVVIGSSASVPHLSIVAVLASLLTLFALAFGLTKLKKEGRRFAFSDIESTFLFVLFILFLFLAVGEYAYATPVAALISGIALKTFIPPKRLNMIESEVKTMCYGFFAPIFFLWIGATMDIRYLASYPLLILLIVLVSNGTKILGSWIIGRKELGTKHSILLGIGISVRFSTSIIIIRILFDNGLVGVGLYSVIVASSIVFKFIIPALFSSLLVRWGAARAA